MRGGIQGTSVTVQTAVMRALFMAHMPMASRNGSVRYDEKMTTDLKQITK